jgi:hypothetical protein
MTGNGNHLNLMKRTWKNIVKARRVILFSAGFTHLDFRTTVRWCGGSDGGGGFAGGRTGIESHNG